jgi:hypothetical protein
MARIRSIHPELFTDEAYMALSLVSPVACMALPGLWTHADDQGVFEWKPLTLKARILPALAVDFADILAAMAEADLVKRFEDDGRPYGAIRNFVRFQRPKWPKILFPLPNNLSRYVGIDDRDTPRDGRDVTVSDRDAGGNGHASSVTCPMMFSRDLTATERQRRKRERDRQNSRDSGGNSHADGHASSVTDVECHGSTVISTDMSRQGRGEESSKKESFALLSDQGSDACDPAPPVPPQRKTRKAARLEPEGFAEFYEVYPRHEARKDAADAYRQVVGEAGGPEVLLAHLRRFRFSQDRQFVPLAASWLRGRRWQDEQQPRVVAAGPAPKVDDRYFDRDPREVVALPKPPTGTLEWRAWTDAAVGRRTPLPGTQRHVPIA